MKRALLSRPVLFLLTVIAALLLLAVGGVVGAQVGSASTRASSSQHTLTLIERNIQVAVIDLGTPGPSMGDLRVGHAQLYNEQGTQLVGRIDFFLSLTDTGATPEPVVLKANYTLSFSQGTIEIGGLSRRAAITSLPPDDRLAITGGTGSYRGVQGEMHLTTRGAVISITLSFTS
jgi:hypothetical protein